MTAQAQDTGPLDWRVGIVDKAGRPTPEFQRRWAIQRDNNGLIGAIATGIGAPPSIPAPTEGQTYLDINSTPWTLYAGHDGEWETVGVVNFTDLGDVPHSYTSSGDMLVKVNAGGTALEFDGISAILDLIDDTQGAIIYRSATGWVSLAPGTAGNALTTGGPAADPSWTVPASGGTTTYFGSGSPSTLHNNGDIYFDKSSGSPYQGYVQDPLVPSGTSPTPRGTNIVGANSGSITISWPAGTVAGDFAILPTGHGYGANQPSGWTQLDNSPGGNFNGAVFSKTLDSGDIAAGSVTVTYGGSYYGVLGVIVFDGTTVSAIRSTTANRSGSSNTIDTLTTPSGVVPTDYGVYWGSNRTTNSPTIDVGTQQQQTSVSDCSAVLNGDLSGVSGTITADFTYPGGNSGFYDAIIIVEGASGSPAPGWVAFT